jgi:hypothetical protein
MNIFSLIFLFFAGYAFGQTGGWNGSSYDYTLSTPSTGGTGAWTGTSYEYSASPYQQPNYYVNPYSHQYPYEYYRHQVVGFGSNSVFSDSSGRTYYPDAQSGYVDSNHVTYRPDGTGGYITSNGEQLRRQGKAFVTNGGVVYLPNGNGYSLINSNQQTLLNRLNAYGLTSPPTNQIKKNFAPNASDNQKFGPCYCGLNQGYCMIFRKGTTYPYQYEHSESCSVEDCRNKFAKTLNGTCRGEWHYWQADS